MKLTRTQFFHYRFTVNVWNALRCSNSKCGFSWSRKWGAVRALARGCRDKIFNLWRPELNRETRPVYNALDSEWRQQIWTHKDVLTLCCTRCPSVAQRNLQQAKHHFCNRWIKFKLNFTHMPGSNRSSGTWQTATGHRTLSSRKFELAVFHGILLAHRCHRSICSSSYLVHGPK